MIHVQVGKHFPRGADSAGFALNLEFESAGHTTVLFGSSGAGKTLTLDCIAGFVRPDHGRILVGDAILFDSAAGVNLTPQQRRCGYVFQNYALFPHMSLRENLGFAAERLPRAERRRCVDEMIERFRLAEVAGRRPRELSGGQKQRCSIARALIGTPRILLLDEPARGLDAPLRSEFYDILRQVSAEFGTPIVLVTHDLEECFELGDFMLVVRNGCIVQSGTPEGIAGRPAGVEIARLLGLYNLLDVELCELDAGSNSSRMRFAGVDLTAPYFEGHCPGDRVMLCVRPSELRAVARDARPQPNQVPLELLRAVEKPNSVRLEFASEVAVEIARSDYDRSVRQWVVEFPPSALSILGGRDGEGGE